MKTSCSHMSSLVPSTSLASLKRRFIAPLLISLVLPVLSSASTVLSFDFSRTTGDRNHYFGTSQPGGSFDNGNANLGFYVQSGVLKSTNVNGGSSPSTYWALVDDTDPDNINVSAPSGNTALKATSDTSISMRTRITSLSSGDSGVVSQAGFLIGLSDTSSTASGWFFALQRTPGSNSSSILTVREFTNGLYGSTILSSSTFTYAGAATFIDFSISDTGSYTFRLFDDTTISGTGDSTTRLNSSDFGTVAAVSSISGTISDYTAGWQGVGFLDGGGTNVGAVNFGNFQMTYTSTIPEPAAASLVLGVASFFMLAYRRRLERI
ncbi:MAG: hypothetical protein ABII82_16890 [Verrucomicrobiota bacterium]